MLITSSIKNLPKLGASWAERQEGKDMGLISAWLSGVEKQKSWLGISSAAKRGELPVLPFKGGVEKPVKVVKTGSLHYIAMWQGLRGDDLNVSIGSKPSMTCSKTGVKVIYTDDINLLGKVTTD